jgi:choline monooxygenase
MTTTRPRKANGDHSVLAGPLPPEPTGSAILPGNRYISETVFAAERDRIFSTGWVWAGYEHWLSHPGAVHPVEVGGKPVLLIRGTDDRIRAFHNSCRHRGMAVVEEPVTVTGRLMCDYHCWTYDLDGSLATAPLYGRARGDRISDEARQRLHLLEVPSAVWAGMVFIDLSPEGFAAKPFDVELAPLLSRWACLPADGLVLAGERRFDIAANWKLVVENFLDFYHLPFIHPQVGPVAASLDVDDLVLSEVIFGAVYPRGAEGKAKKTENPLPSIDDYPEVRRSGQDLFCIFPNTLVILEADWLQVIAFQPVSPVRTVEHMAVFVSPAAAGERFAAARTQLCDTLFHVNEQDLPILAKLQSGRRSPAADSASLVANWDQITAVFQHLVAVRMGRRSPRAVSVARRPRPAIRRARLACRSTARRPRPPYLLLRHRARRPPWRCPAWNRKRLIDGCGLAAVTAARAAPTPP